MKNNREETIIVEGLAYNGYAFGRLSNGKIVFVPCVVPGDKVKIAIEDEKSQYAIGEAIEVVEESVHRVPPECELFTRCGGCQFLNVDYKKQIDERVKIVQREISRSLKKEVTFDGVIESPRLRYRRRAKLFIERKIIGFKMVKSDKVVPVGRCPILTEKLEKALITLYSFNSVLKNGIEVFLGESNKGDEVIVGIKAKEKIREIHDIYHALEDELKVDVGLRIFYPGKYSTLGKSYLRDNLLGETVKYNYFSFFQANIFLVDKLVEKVVDLARGGKKVLELFAGSGTFTIPLSRVVESIVAVELDKKAVELLEKEKPENLEVFNMDVEEFIRKSKEIYDTIILDPPRIGITKDLAERIRGLNADRIIYISCSPPTFARDIKNIGYNLSRIFLFDMFPNTYHIELVALLER